MSAAAKRAPPGRDPIHYRLRDLRTRTEGWFRSAVITELERMIGVGLPGTRTALDNLANRAAVDVLRTEWEIVNGK